VLTTSWIDSPGDGGSDVSRADFDSRSTVNHTPIAFREVEAIRLSTSYEREAGPWQWNATAYARHNRLQLLPSWQLTYDPQVWDTKNRSLGAMLKSRRSFSAARASLIGGLDVDWSPGQRVIDQIVPAMTGPIFTSYTVGERQYDYDVTFRGISPYLQAAASPWPRLHLSGGLRYDHVGYDYETRLDPLASGSHRRPPSTTVDFDHLTPSLGATWELDEARNLFVSYRQGFRVPSEDQLFVQGSSSNTVGLDPVRADSYEGGLRAGVGEALRFEASAYRMDMRDDILSFFNTTDFTSETSNAGRSRHWGIEVGVDGRRSDFRLEASYSYNRHRYLEWVTSTGTDYSGNEMESGPRHLANARLTYSPRFWSGAHVTTEWVHVGEYFTDPENLHTYEGHDLFNLFLAAPLVSGLELMARLNDVGDAIYANTASYNPFVPVEQRERFGPGQPRSLFLGLEYAWGGSHRE
jgi:outer membrane receptor protein involved in Fe transport